MEIRGFNRVELIVAEDEIADAVRQFNDFLGLSLPAPHPIQGTPVLSATDFDGHIELVAPAGPAGHFASRLANQGPGQIGPLVWEVDDIDAARERAADKGFRIIFEYDSSKGNASEQASDVYQLVLDPAQWFGFNVTLMQRGGRRTPR
jgi:catechol 2,3-dioxygenase-like lactoylglutathione lyase family enzyme